MKILSLCLLLTLTANAQNVPAIPTHVELAKDQTKAYTELYQYCWTDKGTLMFAVRIHGGSKQGVVLKGKRTPENEDGAFTLTDSYLIEKHTKEKILPLADLPRRPNFGPSSMFVALSPGGWMQLGIAYPHPTLVPKDEQGKPTDYIFELHLPNDIQPVTFTVPLREAPSSKAIQPPSAFP